MHHYTYIYSPGRCSDLAEVIWDSLNNLKNMRHLYGQVERTSATMDSQNKQINIVQTMLNQLIHKSVTKALVRRLKAEVHSLISHS